MSGHTPGHLGVHSQGQQLLIWGDVVHATKLQLDYPDWTITFDVDADMARATRKRMLDMVAADDILVAGMHLDLPRAATFGGSLWQSLTLKPVRSF
ncbi:hypothetical protein [Pseudohalocynthiibacter sp. F2068]|uniref:hypothetical protein n=1 Tax=Pseudohalocynthiibacter sp. F2068 TaxID=2926418 RepID=UPI001FF2A033|nr:hypothetical protein [Pseudohalocynthiibacter sp. F2068]MCK0104324.1 hypothetical protein [Pseudohalocynthiibacter sp. F2068]